MAGTNGKGSTCATIEAILRAGGKRIGRYTSPHLVDFRERFLVDGRAIEPDYVVGFVRQWTPLVEELGATFFEATTAMAFAYTRPDRTREGIGRRLVRELEVIAAGDGRITLAVAGFTLGISLLIRRLWPRLPALLIGRPSHERSLSRTISDTDVADEPPWMDSRRVRERDRSCGGRVRRTGPAP